MPRFQVNDMTCGHCAATVEKAIKSVDAAAAVKIDLETHTVEIESDRSPDQFATAIDRANYIGRLQA